LHHVKSQGVSDCGNVENKGFSKAISLQLHSGNVIVRMVPQGRFFLAAHILIVGFSSNQIVLKTMHCLPGIPDAARIQAFITTKSMQILFLMDVFSPRLFHPYG